MPYQPMSISKGEIRWLLFLLLLILIIPVMHDHGRGKRLGTCLVVKPYVWCVVSLQHMSLFDYAGGAWAWTRQRPWYLPCGETVCIVCREFATCVHASLALFTKSRSIYMLYACATKGHRNCACTKTKGNAFNY